MITKIKHLKITLQVLFTAAEQHIPKYVLCSGRDDVRLVDQIIHLTSDIGTYVSDDRFINPESFETVRVSLYDACSVLVDRI